MSRSFLKVSIFACAFTLLFGIARKSVAQEDDKDAIRPMIKQGSTALIFELAGFGTFGFSGPGIAGYPSSFPGMPAVGARYYIADGTALFVVVGLSTNSGSDSVPSTQSAKQSYTAFGIGAGVQFHCHPLYSTSPYWGAMVSFGSNAYDNGGSGDAEFKQSGSTFAIAALGGFDWYFTHGLFLGGEVGLGFKTSSGSTTSEGTTTSSQGTTTIFLATNASVHLGVHF